MAQSLVTNAAKSIAPVWQSSNSWLKMCWVRHFDPTKCSRCNLSILLRVPQLLHLTGLPGVGGFRECCGQTPGLSPFRQWQRRSLKQGATTCSHVNTYRVNLPRGRPGTQHAPLICVFLAKSTIGSAQGLCLRNVRESRSEIAVRR